MSEDPDREHPFPWPLTIVVAALLLALGLGLRSVLTPPLAGAALVYLLLPYRRQAWVLRALLVISTASFLWIVARFSWLLFVLGSSFFLAYVLNPGVRFLEQRRLRRSLAVPALLFPFVAVVGVLLLLFLPPVLDQLRQLLLVLPQIPDRIGEFARPLAARLHLEPLNMDQAQLAQFLAKAQAILSRVLEKILHLVLATGSVLGALALVPFCTYYILLDVGRFRARGTEIIPPKYHPWLTALAGEMDTLLGRWLRGIALIAVLVGALTVIGLTALGIPYALTLGALAAVLNLVPVLGFWASLITAALVGLVAAGGLGLLKVVALYFAVSALESQILSPRLVGRAVGLHPVVVLLALVVFSQIFGLIGAFLAVPLTLFLSILGRQVVALYHASDLYTGPPRT